MTREQLLNEPGLQVVLVETEIDQLLDNAELCIAAGKHVHLDKPAGQSFAQYQRILNDAEPQNLLVQMGYMYRYNPAVTLLHEFFRNGWLGEVFGMHTVMSKVVPPQGRRQLAIYPGGILFELGCHILDLAIGVLGEPAAITSVRQHVSNIDDGLLDNMLAFLTYPKAIATVKSSAVEVERCGSRRVCTTTLRRVRSGRNISYSAVRCSVSTDHVVEASRFIRTWNADNHFSKVSAIRG